MTQAILPGPPGRVEALDALRGLAALAVVLFHLVGFLPLYGVAVGPAGATAVAVAFYGSFGVQVFFALSGFVVAMTAARYPFTPGTAARFVLRRLVRLAPPYWAMIGLIVAAHVAGKAAGYFRGTTITPGQVAAHLGYVQNLLGLPPLDVIYWTLCLEVQFYLVFAIVAAVVRPVPSGWRTAGFAALTAGSAVADFADAVPVEWFPRLWYQFGVGVLAFEAGRDRTARAVAGVFLPTLVAAGAIGGRPAAVVAAGVAGVLAVTSRAPGTAVPCPRVLLWLGRISYSLYLVHGLVGTGVSVLVRAAVGRPEALAWAVVAGGVGTAVAAAAGFSRLCERPAVAWSRRVRVGPGRP